MRYAYVVTAYRWADRDNHSYVVGVASTPEGAIRLAHQEQRDRGGKYWCEALEILVDDPREQSRLLDQPPAVIHPLPERGACCAKMMEEE